MGSTAKALKLLDYFSVERPSIGLTQFAKLAGYDKATTHRRLSDLAATGFIEQDANTRAYRLGPAVLRLSNVRERTFPTREAALPALQALAQATSETVHLSLIEGDTGLATIAYFLSNHSIRVHIDEAQVLPFHATASGIACMAFSSPDFQQQVLSNDLKSNTKQTITDKAAIKAIMQDVAISGISRNNGGFESDVTGFAAPVFDRQGYCTGSVAVASPSARVSNTEDAQTRISALQIAATAITTAWGGKVPVALKKAWS